MKTKVLIILAILATVFGIGKAGTIEATGDVYSCPPGTTHDYKIEPLSGKTFTVPNPPSGWVITAVILKVGGGGNDADVHIPFLNPTPGSTLSVAYQQHDISHAHICKAETPPPTTGPDEEPPDTTSTTTTSTTVPGSTTTSTFPPESPPLTPPTDPEPSFPVPTDLQPTSVYVSPCVQNPAQCSPASTTTAVLPARRLPETGPEEDFRNDLMTLALIAGVGGSGALIAARRRS